MKAIETNIYNLCQQIDELMDEVAYWRKKYEDERDAYNNTLNHNMEMAKKGVANALRFALSVKDDEEGNLVISKEDRKQLAQSFT